MLIFQKLIGTDKNKQKSVPMYHERAKHENRTRNPYYFGSTVLGIIKTVWAILPIVVSPKRSTINFAR